MVSEINWKKNDKNRLQKCYIKSKSRLAFQLLNNHHQLIRKYICKEVQRISVFNKGK